MRLDAIAFGVITRIYLQKIKNNLANIFLAILIVFIMNYFLINLKDLTVIELFLFVVLIQFFSINMIIIFVNFNKIIVNKFLVNFFSLLSKQTYSIYLFHFVIIHLISQNIFLLDQKLIFPLYIISLFLFSSIFYYVFEKGIVENRPTYKLS